MIRRPPRSTRTDTLFPYTTLFRSAGSYAVASVEKRETRRNPQPPFTTSTLQQEGSRKLRLSASRTMRIAQRLYEGVDIGGETVGLITYMRTDSVTRSEARRVGKECASTGRFGCSP